MDALQALAPYVPLAQTLLWVGLIVGGGTLFRKQIHSLVDAVRVRIQTGSSIKAGPIELGEDLRNLEKIPAASAKPSVLAESGAVAVDRTAEAWSKARDALYASTRGVFLAHVIEPSSKQGQDFDIFIFLVRHKSTDFADVQFAEFFLGSYWENRIFREEAKNGLIGISTSAYGPMLCTARVHFRDGKVVELHRYIDFEMGRVFERGRLTSRIWTPPAT